MKKIFEIDIPSNKLLSEGALAIMVVKHVNSNDVKVTEIKERYCKLCDKNVVDKCPKQPGDNEDEYSCDKCSADRTGYGCGMCVRDGKNKPSQFKPFTSQQAHLDEVEFIKYTSSIEGKQIKAVVKIINQIIRRINK